MRRSGVLAVGAALAAVVTLTAAGAVEDLPKFKAGLSSSFLSSPFFVVLTSLTTQSARAAGLTWLQPTDAQSDPGKQIADIQTLVNSGAQGLIVVPRDSDAIAPALQYAASRNVPVVAVDVSVHTGKVAMTVRADNVGMARSACEAVGAALGDRVRSWSCRAICSTAADGSGRRGLSLASRRSIRRLSCSPGRLAGSRLGRRMRRKRC